jgi:membrane protein required for colicin V production
MNWLDVVLAIILIASILTSFRKGLSREVIGLISVVLALLLGVWFYGTAGSFLLPYVSSRSVANLVGFFLVFCGVMVAGAVASYLAGRFLQVTGLSILDHALGAGFGLVRGILVAVGVILAIMAFTPGERPPDSVIHSRTAPYVVDAARVVALMAPKELKDSFRKTYAEVKDAWDKAVDKGMRTAPGTTKGQHEREI